MTKKFRFMTRLLAAVLAVVMLSSAARMSLPVSSSIIPHCLPSAAAP